MNLQKKPDPALKGIGLFCLHGCRVVRQLNRGLQSGFDPFEDPFGLWFEVTAGDSGSDEEW